VGAAHRCPLFARYTLVCHTHAGNGEFDSSEDRLSAGTRGACSAEHRMRACADARRSGGAAGSSYAIEAAISALVCTAETRKDPAAGPGWPLVWARCALDPGLTGCAHRVLSDRVDQDGQPRHASLIAAGRHGRQQANARRSPLALGVVGPRANGGGPRRSDRGPQLGELMALS